MLKQILITAKVSLPFFLIVNTELKNFMQLIVSIFQ
jgi:hypothetical protein